MKKNNAICMKCGNGFVMGYAGVVMEDNETELCDTCAGVERDLEGRPWFPGELVHVYIPIATADDLSTAFEVKREDAFRRKSRR